MIGTQKAMWKKYGSEKEKQDIDKGEDGEMLWQQEQLMKKTQANSWRP